MHIELMDVFGLRSKSWIHSDYILLACNWGSKICKAIGGDVVTGNSSEAQEMTPSLSSQLKEGTRIAYVSLQFHMFYFYNFTYWKKPFSWWL